MEFTLFRDNLAQFDPSLTRLAENTCVDVLAELNIRLQLHIPAGAI